MKRRSIAWLTLCATAVLFVVPSAQASPGDEGVEAIQQFLTMIRDYIEVSERWVVLISEPDFAAYMVAEGIVEIYEEKGDKAGAIPELRQMLDRYGDNPRVQRLIRFKIRDIYKETGHHDKALQELRAILDTDRG